MANALTDRFGGDATVELDATGRFRVERDDQQRWWFVTPDGHPFWSHGLQCLLSEGTVLADGRSPYADGWRKRHDTLEDWAVAKHSLLERAGLNTLGDWSDTQHFPTTPFVNGIQLSHHAPIVQRGPDAFRGRARDFFDPSFASSVDNSLAELAVHRDNPFWIGAFHDDEVSWAASFLMPLPYLDYYLYLENGQPGKIALQRFLEEHYRGDIESLNRTWSTKLNTFAEIQEVDPLQAPWAGGVPPWRGTPAQQADRTAFRAHVAERFFQVTTGAHRRHLPDVLNLGPRFLTGNMTADVIEVAARYVDVVSINAFEISADALELTKRYAWTGSVQPEPLFADVRMAAEVSRRPILLSSFSYRAEVPGLNDFPPTTVFDILATQEDRADRYERYMRAAFAIPQVVGAHWFSHADQPSEGRPDGENSNFGIVNIDDEPYAPLVDRMGAVSRDLYQR